MPVCECKCIKVWRMCIGVLTDACAHQGLRGEDQKTCHQIQQCAERDMDRRAATLAIRAAGFICTRAYMRVCVCVYVHMYTHTHTHTATTPASKSCRSCTYACMHVCVVVVVVACVRLCWCARAWCAHSGSLCIRDTTLHPYPNPCTSEPLN